ncbi:GNAT family N-acetyltransferase [Allokutzneria sp. A3M-2-11 16]|uniref:GNAT family N-acetyltransferase n=1 Tax=Allokutzneria sp. A3M-2-11 16 TaxID=2962043 RepID=UPI0020B71D14|nr:GNAT family N-acetyltransferase [Allokutzneria sp. A3M-2-11 16]MCP3804990.1 GNAT family N-acetyltransferase [Allokutzneria sp. A3M-2-11 16]
MVEISFVTASDRADWEVLARGHHSFFGTEVSDEGYEQTWGRLLDGGQVRGILARLDGKAVGVAHYVFHASIWGAGRCYMADLFVAPEVRRRGVASAMIEWVARDAEEHGAPRLYWNTLEDAEARALYDKVASFKDGLMQYFYRRETTSVG